MVEIITNGIFTLVGVVIGWGLTEISSVLRARPKLCFQMTSTPDDKLTEKGLRTETSLSEYGVEIFNMGEKPVIVESFTLSIKKTTISDCVPSEESRVILPYHSMVYTLMEQEAGSMEHHCKKKHFEECDVTVHCVDGKNIKGKLSTPLISLRASFSESISS